jgi:hypothetical protein
MREWLWVIALSILLSTTAVAAPNSDNGQQKSLCDSGETVLFSCDIGGKRLSLCGSQEKADKSLLIQYRFGHPGITPELEYPSMPTAALSAFGLATVDNTSGFPLQTISFSRPSASYDIMTPDQADYSRWAPFTGVGVTTRGKETTLLSCDENTTTVNLAPLRKALGLSADAPLSDTLPKYPFEKAPYPTVNKKKPCGSHCKCEVKYPIIRDRAITRQVKSFMKGGCEDGAEVIRTVTASITSGKYLSLSFSHYYYAYGTPHGYGNEEIKLFRKGKNGWVPLGKEALFDSESKCEDKINSLLFRQLKPQLSRLESQEGLLDGAQVAIGSQGIIFSYAQYELGAYAEGPLPVLLPYKALGSCLRIVP